MENSDEDFFVDDLIKNINEKSNKKRKKSGSKGKRGERDLCKIFTERFNLPFSRVIGSGNRWSQAKLTEEAKLVLTGDISTPKNFKFCIESKIGYKEIDLNSALESGHKTLNEFLKQAENDSKRVNKYPMLCWKKDNKPWMCFVKKNLIKTKYQFSFHYNEWIALALSQILKEKDEFFFKND